MNRSFLLAIPLACLLAGCETQRTVLKTESRMSFGDEWSQQLGDVDGLKEKFASGFEIKDGRAVAAGESQKESRRDKKSSRFNLNGEDMELPKSHIKKVRTGPLARFAKDESSDVERFAGVGEFNTEDFNRDSFSSSEKSPSDSRKIAPWANRDSNIRSDFGADSIPSSGKTYETEANRDADQIFATEASRDAESRFDFRGRRDMDRSESYEQRTAQHAKAGVNISNPADPEGSMTVDDVRRLLNPAGSAGS